MKKLKSTLPNMFFSLTIICAGAGAILAGVNNLTMAPIAASKDIALVNAIKQVTPAFDNNPVKESYKAGLSEGDSLLIYPAKMGGKLVGVAVESNTKKGFSGEIKVIVGFDEEGKLLNYSVLQHAETPGLGARMQEWFRTDKNKQSVLGRSLSEGDLAVAKDGGDVDAITAATITSRAFLDAVNRAYNAYAGKKEYDGESGATANTEKDQPEPDQQSAPQIETSKDEKPEAPASTDSSKVKPKKHRKHQTKEELDAKSGATVSTNDSKNESDKPSQPQTETEKEEKNHE